MADEEQLKILKQGVELWNQWREGHPNERVDLSKADLRKENLICANLSKADLSEANLTGANLRNANLQSACLRQADLSAANLYRAQLYRADFRDSHLHKTDLREADLRKASFHKALIDDTTKIDSKWKLAWELVNVQSQKCHILNKIDLSWTDLSGANLAGSDLSETDLTEASLYKAELNGADMERSVLERANLQFVNFSGANLRHTNLCHANLTEATLIAADLSGAVLTGAKLYGTRRDDWIITDVKCEYIFWEQSNEERTPPNRVFRPGEFEELYAQLPEITYYFVQGFTAIDAVVMSKVVETINLQNPEYDLKLDSFHSRGQPHAKFTILYKKDAEKVLRLITESFESKIKALEAQKEQLMDVIKMLGSGQVAFRPVVGGITIRRSLSPELTQQVVEFFGLLPGMESEDARRAWINSASLDHVLHQQIQFGGTQMQFFQLLLPILVSYGTLHDGRPAIDAVLVAARQMLGKDRQEYCERLLERIHEEIGDV